MTKAELIDAVHAKLAEGSKKDCADFVDATFDSLSSAINDGGRFSFPGFGTFTVKQRAERQGRNPRTGQAITIPASKTVSFKPASSFKGSL